MARLHQRSLRPFLRAWKADYQAVTPQLFDEVVPVVLVDNQSRMAPLDYTRPSAYCRCDNTTSAAGEHSGFSIQARGGGVRFELFMGQAAGITAVRFLMRHTLATSWTSANNPPWYGEDGQSQVSLIRILAAALYATDPEITMISIQNRSFELYIPPGLLFACVHAGANNTLNMSVHIQEVPTA